MYALVDRSVSALSNGSRFMLWSMRAWAFKLEQRHCPVGALGPAFAKMGALEALPDFHIAMSLLNKESLDKLSVSPLSACHINEDEAILLALWSDVAKDVEDHARRTISFIVNAESVTSLLRAMRGAAAKLAEADLVPDGVAPSAPDRTSRSAGV